MKEVVHQFEKRRDILNKKRDDLTEKVNNRLREEKEKIVEKVA